MLTVFHEASVIVDRPDISFSRDRLDFGKGFYVTPLYKQAVLWALRWKHRQQKAIVNTYRFHDEFISEMNLKTKTFAVYDQEWLRFMAANREGGAVERYDIVQGGIANDKVFNTLELYFDKLISEEEALRRLKFEEPNHQICICRQDLIERLLLFVSAEEVKDGSQ